MTLKTSLRCDWEGDTKESGCPSCGVPPYEVGPTRPPPRNHHDRRSPGASITEAFSQPEPGSCASQTRTDRLGPSGRPRAVGAFALVPDPPGTVGHGGEHEGYVSLTGCLPEDGSVVVVLSNDVVDLSAVAQRLLDTVRSTART